MKNYPKSAFREMSQRGRLSVCPYDVEGVDNTQDETLKMIFAPDPRTGLPRSDIAIILSKDSRPEISQFVRDTLMQNLGDTVRADSPDMVIEATRSRGESLTDYSNRIKAIAEKYNKKEESK